MGHDTAHPARIIRRPSIDLAVDIGFAILLLVCALRYFSYHSFVDNGAAVLLLAIGAGLSYAAAVIGPRGTAGLREKIGLLAATAFWLPLVVIAPSFGWCAFALFFAVHRVLRGKAAFIISGLIVLAVSVGLYVMSSGADFGLVLGPFFGGLVLSSAYAALDRAFSEQQSLISELIETREQLARSEREAGALAERGRVASELHDTVVQRTASTLFLLESDDMRPGGSSPQVSEARESLRDALIETRRLLHGLADPRETAASLTSVLEAQAIAGGATFSCVGNERNAPEMVIHTLQRVVQEAILNAKKHSGADDMRVTLTYFADTIGVDIADNGSGFIGSPEQSNSTGTGFGIRAMTWRINNLGGELTIESQPGHGTVVAAVVPFPRESEPS